MSPTNPHKYKYFHSTVQRAKDRRQKFHFCSLPFDVRPRNVKLNLSYALKDPRQGFAHRKFSQNFSSSSFVIITNGISVLIFSILNHPCSFMVYYLFGVICNSVNLYFQVSFKL